MKRTLHGMLALIAVLFLHAPGLSAQVDRATLSGVVRDTGGGVVPGATVTVTNTATNIESHQATSETGSYQVVNLVPGRYQVDVELSGFKKSSQVVALEVGQRARLDVELAVGSFCEVVTVAESAQLLNSNDATLGAVIPQMQVANLPLAIRNWDDLLALVPGVQGDRYTEQGGGTSFGRTGGINVHGARALQNNFLLDGVDNNSISENVQELTTQVSRPSVDAIQEFKVVTSPYSAEYGRSPGAAVSVSTKSGTNGIQGHAVRLLPQRIVRLQRLLLDPRQRGQAGQRSEPVRRQPRRADRQGQGVLLRRLRRDADHARRHPPDARADRGRARRHLHLGGQGSADRPATSRTTRFPASRIDPYAAAIIGLVPLPNQPGANNFFRTADLIDNSDRLLTRFDYKPHVNDSIFGRYIYSNRTRQIPGAFGGVVDGTGTSAFGDQTIKTNALVGGWTRVISSAMVNEFRISWSKSVSDARAAVVRPDGAGRRDDSRIGDQPARRRRSPRHHDRRLLRRIGPRPHRLARLPAEVPAHEPVRVHRQHLVAARQPRASRSAPTSSCRCRTSTWTCRRRAARCASARRSPATRWPTTCSATSPTCSCRTCSSPSSVTARRCTSSRTTGR